MCAETIDRDLELEPGADEYENVRVRALTTEDLDAITRIDRKITGTDRRGYYRQRLHTALEESGIRVSLAAEVDGVVAGFVLGRVYHGEYGRTESFATLDSIGVAPGYRGQGVGRALLRQLLLNLRALRIERLQTEVEWNHWELLRFLQESGFRPAPRLCLERAL